MTTSFPDSGGDRVDQRRAQAGRDIIGFQRNETHNHYALAAPTALQGVPAPPDGFTGRETELGTLLARLEPASGSAAVVTALVGMGGIGKTALVLKAAATAAEREWFYARLWVDLQGYTPGAQPLAASAALDTLLRATGTEPDDIPAEQVERAAFYRSALDCLSQADERRRPILVVADNAASLDQVELLHPGPGNRLVVTSRERLTVDGAAPLTLSTFTPGEAVELLVARIGEDDARASDLEALHTLAARCGLLPLALKIAASHLARTPHLGLADFTERLGTGGFSDGRHDLATVFNESLKDLPEEHVRVLTLIGHHFAPDISTAAAGALTGLNEDRVKRILDDLCRAHLVTFSEGRPSDDLDVVPHSAIAPSGGRWSMHDLLAEHTRGRPKGLALSWSPGFEAVEFDSPVDGDGAGLVGAACGEVAGFLGFAGAGAVGAVADEGVWSQDFQQEGGEGEVTLVRGESPP